MANDPEAELMTDQYPNMDTNYSDLTINDSLTMDNDEPSHAPVNLLVSFATALIVLLIIGILGNSLAIFSILRPIQKKGTPTHSPTRRRWGQGRPWQQLTMTNAYIISLSAADLLFLLFCAPFQGTVYILNHWPYGWVICKLAHFCQYCTVYASVWILTAMSIDRYTAIGYPLKTVKWRRSRRAAKVSACIWIVAALASSPWLFLYESTDVQTITGTTVTACYDGWSEELYQYRKWMLLFVACIGFVIPAVIIFVMAILIAKSIRSTFSEPLFNETRNSGSVGSAAENEGSSFRQRRYLRLSQRRHPDRANSAVFKRRRRACWLVFVLALIFFIFQGPQNVSLLWINFDGSAVEWILDNSETFFVLRLLAHMMTYVNSVLNPILYGLASGRIRSFLRNNEKQPTIPHGERVLAAVPAQPLQARRAKKPKSPIGPPPVAAKDPPAPPDYPTTESLVVARNYLRRNVIDRLSMPDSCDTFSAGDTADSNDWRRVAVRHAAIRRMSSTVSAFV